MMRTLAGSVVLLALTFSSIGPPASAIAACMYEVDDDGNVVCTFPEREPGSNSGGTTDPPTNPYCLPDCHFRFERVDSGYSCPSPHVCSYYWDGVVRPVNFAEPFDMTCHYTTDSRSATYTTTGYNACELHPQGFFSEYGNDPRPPPAGSCASTYERIAFEAKGRLSGAVYKYDGLWRFTVCR